MPAIIERTRRTQGLLRNIKFVKLLSKISCIEDSLFNVWLVEKKPIWLPRAYLTRGDLDPARGNVHVCKLVRELTNIQIRTVTAERQKCSKCICPTNALQRKEGRKAGRREPEGEREGRKEGRKDGRRTREKAREKEHLPREGESARLNTP